MTHARSGRPRAGARRRAAVALYGVLGVVAALVAGAVTATAATPTPQLIVRDRMQRTVTAGLGNAGLGGPYVVSPSGAAAVSSGAAHLGPVSAGHAVSAYLSAISVADVRATVHVRPAHRYGIGLGFYFDVVLRRLAKGDGYLAKIHYLADGRVFLGLSRFQNSTETFLGPERQITAATGSTGWLDVEAQVTGSAPVTIGAKAWPDGATVPAGWQASYTDSGSQALTAPGAVGLFSYLSATASAQDTMSFTDVSAWNLAPSNPPPSAPTISAGSAPVGTTRYPVPANAVFVAPGGNDSSPGTIGGPLATLAQAVKVAPANSTIVLRGGTYNESVTIQAGKSLTVQSYPGEAVWLDGSVEVGGWTASGSTWVHSGWTPQFDSTPSYDPAHVPSGPGWSFVNPAYPMAAHPDQVWLDGKALAQVGSPAQVGTGTFYVDYAANELVLGDNPIGHSVRASNLSVALSSYASNTTIRGIGIRRYATPIDQIGALRLVGAGDVAENVVSTENATTGITADAADITVRNVTLTANGMLGMHASYADGLTVAGVSSTGNNIEHFNSAPVSGGIKIARSRVVTVRDSVISDNLGYGLWFDESTYDMTVVHNRIENNTAHGLSVEISALAVVAGNVVADNAQDGVKINDTNGVRFWANTVTGNGRQVEIVQDTRRGANLADAGHDPRQPQPDPTEPWIIQDVQVADNFIGATSGSYGIYNRDYSAQFSAAMLNLVLNGNRFLQSPTATEIVWQSTPIVLTTYNSVAAFAQATGQGGKNSEQTAPTLASSTAGTPLSLPADIAVLLGLPAGTALTGAP
jgi:hypothetical protein